MLFCVIKAMNKARELAEKAKKQEEEEAAPAEEEEPKPTTEELLGAILEEIGQEGKSLPKKQKSLHNGYAKPGFFFEENSVLLFRFLWKTTRERAALQQGGGSGFLLYYIINLLQKAAKICYNNVVKFCSFFHKRCRK